MIAEPKISAIGFEYFNILIYDYIILKKLKDKNTNVLFLIKVMDSTEITAKSVLYS